MQRRRVIAGLFAFWCLAVASLARQAPSDRSASELSSANAQRQDFSESVVPITSLKFRGPVLQADFGTGFCLDPECRFIGTNYHVAVAEKHLKIGGTRVVQRYLVTGPKDENATLNYLASGGPPLRYTLSRDLAVFELAKPLPHHRGLGFSTDDLRVGQAVDIYAYPKGVIDPLRSLQVFHGTFRGPTTTDLLAFDYVPNGNQSIRPGASGGIVVDRKTGKVVGILSGVDSSGQPILLAVPVESLAGFLYKELPFLAELLFPILAEVPEDQPDLHSKYDPPTETGDLRRRPAEPSDVTELRKRAQALAKGMRNFIAVQTFVWGKGNQRPIAADAYEVQVRDGAQMFRQYPGGKKWSSRPPRPQGASSAISPGNVWSTLPLFIGTHVGVKIHQAAGTDLDGRRLRVFQYLGSLEDNPCVVVDVFDFGLFSIEKDHTYTAYGEVWTDEDLNIVRMSLHCENHGRQEYQNVVDYGWLTRPGVEPQLVPVTLVAWAPAPNKGIWCRSQFVNYHEFVGLARLVYEQLPLGAARASQDDQSGNSVRKK
jgi:Trypsin-like peptidase domain